MKEIQLRQSYFLVYQAEDGQLKIDVRFKNESVWLTQANMAELFQCSTDNISLHIKNIYEEGELEQQSTTEEFSVVRQEGKRQVKRNQTFYNLDVIISVGYRVKSHLATWGSPVGEAAKSANRIRPLPRTISTRKNS